MVLNTSCTPTTLSEIPLYVILLQTTQTFNSINVYHSIVLIFDWHIVKSQHIFLCNPYIFVAR